MARRLETPELHCAQFSHLVTALRRMTSRMHIESAPSLDTEMTVFNICQDQMLWYFSMRR